MDKFSVSNENEFVRIPLSEDASEINLNDVTSINGIYELNILTSGLFGDCKFFLMSDIHLIIENGFKDNGSGLYLPIFLDALFKQNKDKQFDVLLEAPPLKKAPKLGNVNSGAMASMYKQFDYCFASLDGGKACSKEWPNVRFHNVDIRQIHHDKGQTNFDFPLLNFTKSIHGKAKILKMALIFDTEVSPAQFNEMLLDPVMELLNQMKSKSFGEYYISEIYKHEKYSRYKNLELCNDVNEIIKKYLNLHSLVNNIFDDAPKLKEKGNAINKYEIKSFVKKTADLFTNLRSTMVDMYFLLRILKIISYGGKNIFLYAGKHHTDSIKSIIESIDYFSSEYIQGNTLVNDSITKTFASMVNRNKIKIPFDISKIIIRPEILVDLIKDYTDYASLDEEDLKIIKNLSKMVELDDYLIKNKVNATARKPGKKLAKISYSTIKNIL